MDRKLSILILPARGTRTLRLVVSKNSMRYLRLGVIALLGLGVLLLGDYLHLKLKRTNLQDLRVEAEAQREKLSALQRRAHEIQGLLAHWKGLQDKLKASLPSQRKVSANSNGNGVEELENSLGLLQGELESLIASIPTSWPANGRVTSGVGRRLSPWSKKEEFHSGIDIPNPMGTPIYAPGDGVVGYVGENARNGRAVVLDHGQGITTHYAHLSKTFVKKGERVRKGHQIAAVGNTGRSTSSHLHYEVRVNGTPIDPRRHLLK